MKVNCKNYAQVIDLADQHGLKTVELTSGSNGYPQNLRLCIAGFKTYDQAEALAKKTGGEVTSICRRDGWQLSQSQGWASRPYDIKALLQKDYECESIDIISNNGSDIDSYLEDVKVLLKQVIEDADDFDGLKGVDSILSVAQKAASMVEDLDDDEFLFIINGEMQVRKAYDTYYRHDVWTYDIAVEFDCTD